MFSEGLCFESHPGHLILTAVFRAHTQSLLASPATYLKDGHGHILPHHLQFLYTLSPHQATQPSNLQRRQTNTWRLF